MSREKMNERCRPYAARLDAWFDGELEGTPQARELADHLESCADCRADLEAMRLIHQGVRKIPRPAASPRLRESVRSRLIPAEARNPRQEGMVRVMNRPAPALAVAAVSLMLIGMVGMIYWNYRSGAGFWPAISAQTPPGEDHISLVQSDGGAFLHTDDPMELESWFAERLIFPPPVPNWPWAHLEGGRICFIKGHRVARIQYAADTRTFSLFVQYVGATPPPGNSGECTSGKTASIIERQGYKAASWSKDGFSYVLVAHRSADPVFYYLQHE